MNVQTVATAVAHQKEVTVQVTHLGEHEKATFKVLLTITLQALWDESYKQLHVAKKPRDIFQAPGKPNPIDLMPYLTATLDEARRRGLCKEHFEIAAGTGGA